MNTEQMRTEFEKWAKSTIGRLSRNNEPGTDLCGYKDSHTNLCWLSWQQSRAALVVNLPRRTYFGNCGDDYYDATLVDRTLSAAGIKVKS